MQEAHAQIIDYLNEKAGTRYTATSKQTVKEINARLKEGFAIDDFLAVIDYKVNTWLHDDHMREYIRPITLFGTKFEAYLNAARMVTNPIQRKLIANKRVKDLYPDEPTSTDKN